MCNQYLSSSEFRKKIKKSILENGEKLKNELSNSKKSYINKETKIYV